MIKNKCICPNDKTGTKKQNINTNVLAKRVLAGQLLGMKANPNTGRVGMAQFKKVFSCVEPVYNQTSCRAYWDLTRRVS